MTVWEGLKNDWIIKKSTIKDFGIDPNKDYDELTLRELNIIADHLDVTIGDIVD